jgi:hypothetical protein
MPMSTDVFSIDKNALLARQPLGSRPLLGVALTQDGEVAALVGLFGFDVAAPARHSRSDRHEAAS